MRIPPGRQGPTLGLQRALRTLSSIYGLKYVTGRAATNEQQAAATAQAEQEHSHASSAPLRPAPPRQRCPLLPPPPTSSCRRPR